MKPIFLYFLFGSFTYALSGQTNMHFTNPEILDIIKGNYDPQDYFPSVAISDPEFISTQILSQINPDSLKASLFALRSFGNRNTGSDTLSLTRGMGAARKWVLNKFNQYSEANESRLVTGYLQFDVNVCGMLRHKNVVAVLPGLDTSNTELLLVEAHLDSRCEGACDTICLAEGMEDNGSGVALVLELARVLSNFAFDRSIMFVTTTAEEQTLVGADAIVIYFQEQNIPFKAAFNNDVVGGIVCGETSSPPSCPGFNHIDSTQVRLFSYGGFNSPYKALARYIKLEYQDMLLDKVAVPMMITIMSAEDRTGRGGDHIPFREKGMPAVRFTSANEHGNANVADPDYHDRQHTSEDILGVDTDGDSVIDSFFVDFNYLARNTSINANAIAMAALSPEIPVIKHAGQDGDKLYIEMEDPYDYNHYAVGLRVNSNDFDTVYYINGSKKAEFILPDRELNLFISAASIDSDGVESFFTEEQLVRLTGTEDLPDQQTVELLQNKPNPFDESTIISFMVQDPTTIKDVMIVITDLEGRKVKEFPVEVKPGMNEVLYHHGYNMVGTYLYSLLINGKLMATKKMIFAN